MRTHDLIRESRGKIFSVDFYKKDGSLRKMKARLGVTKGVKGVGLRYDPLARGLLPVWDLDKGAFRMINLTTIRRLKVNGQEYHFQVNPPRFYQRFGGRVPDRRVYRDAVDRAMQRPVPARFKKRVGCYYFPEGDGWRVDVFADKTMKVGCTEFGEESTRKAYDLLKLIFGGKR